LFNQTVDGIPLPRLRNDTRALGVREGRFCRRVRMAPVVLACTDIRRRDIFLRQKAREME